MSAKIIITEGTDGWFVRTRTMASEYISSQRSQSFLEEYIEHTEH